MIHYHGTPITPESALAVALAGGHAFVSYSFPLQLATVLECCQSFAIDNGAFGAWQKGAAISDWTSFYGWAEDCLRYPSCDFAVIPDVIDGDEAANDALIAEWPLARHMGAPVWHMHESLERLVRLASEWSRVCISSSGQYAQVDSPEWHARMRIAMLSVCDPSGRPITKLHGLRMLNPRVFSKYPFASADSTNLGRNIGIDDRWTGSYAPVGNGKKAARAAILRQRIEAFNAPVAWNYS